MRARLRALWPAARYERLLPPAAHSRALGRAYAIIAGTAEYGLDAHRRRIAAGRIARWLGASALTAHRIFRASLISEAQEEADSVFFMRHTGQLAGALHAPARVPPHRGPTIYATLHFGSPILAYLHLCRGRGLDVTAIGRRLSEDNPMPAAKRRYGLRKVAWVERLTAPFLDVDGPAILRARERLLDGGSLYAAVDVPADVVTRTAEVTLFGERTRMSSGVVTLASLVGVPVQPIVGVSRRDGIEIHYGHTIAALDTALTLDAVARELFAFVRRWPGEWWLWPYLTP